MGTEIHEQTAIITANIAMYTISSVFCLLLLLALISFSAIKILL